MPANRLLAAVDLGSNSFRLLIARVERSPLGELAVPLDSVRQSVRLASGLRSDGTLDDTSRQRALVALAGFGERLRSFSPDAVRAVATSTLRVARNAHRFLPTAEAALGFPIEIVSGLEEARLIYLGAAHALPCDGEPRLVVDIGGGSTECIVGIDMQAKALESAGVGCVVLSNRHFPGGRVCRSTFEDAYYEARAVFASIAASFGAQRWRYAVGTSGTAKSLWQVARAHWDAEALDRASLERTHEALVDAGDVHCVRLSGLTPDRRPVLAGGLAVMMAVFDELRIDAMQYCNGALRQGVLYDLLGRDEGRDVRALAIEQMLRRHHVDVAHARRVRDTALALFDQGARGAREVLQVRRRLLGWAAELAEVGRSVTHEDFHRHSAYILAHAEMPGFSQREQDRLAQLALTQTGSLDSLRGIVDDETAALAVLALRVATILHRRRDDAEVPTPALFLSRGTLRLETTAAWAARFPLSHQSLVAEARAWTEARVFERFVYETIGASATGTG
ncbi:MAG TPA: Ppx/GppA phosphatase family protein [Zeimonas sp.]